MKQLLTLIFLVISLTAFSQANDTTKYYKDANYGTQSKRAKIDSILQLPNGTVINRAWQFPTTPIDTTSRFGGVKSIYRSYLDSLLLATAIQKNTDSIAQHNLRIGANTVNIGANTANIAANTSAIAGKVSKWERWTDTLFVQKYDTSKTAFTIKVDSNSTTKPTIKIIDSINRTLFEMRASPIKFNSENMFFGIGSGQKLKPIYYNSPTYGFIIGGTSNTAFGAHALENLVDGNENTAIGWASLQNLKGANGGDPNLVGSLNTGIGSWTLRDLTTGIGNFAGGQKAGNGLTTGSYNVMIGKSNGEIITTGSGNVMIGALVGKYTSTNTEYNTWIGSGAGYQNTGTRSILLGANSGSKYITISELVAGDSTDFPINDWWSGKGKYSSSPTAWTIHGTRGWGSNISGGNLNLAAGEATGTGTSGNIVLQVSKPISSGTQQHYLIDAVTVSSLPNQNGGGVGINRTPTNALDVVNTSTNRTVNDTVVYVGNTGSSYVVAGGAMSSIGLRAESKSFNLSGTGTLTNIAIRATANRGDRNIAFAADSGNVVIGDTTTTNKFQVKNGTAVFDWAISTPTITLNKDSIVNGAFLIPLAYDSTNGKLRRANPIAIGLGSAAYTGQDSISWINSTGRAVIRKNAGNLIINNGNYNSTDAQIDFNNDNATGTLGIYNSTVRAKRLFVNGINYYFGGSDFQVNGSAAIGSNSGLTAPTNGLTVIGKTLIGSSTDNNNGQLQVTGNLSLNTAGSKLNIATGTNASVGTATLSSGTVTVSTTAVTASSLIFVTYNTPSGTLAAGLSAPAGSIVAGTSFVINSLTTAGMVNTLDNSTVRWWIIN